MNNPLHTNDNLTEDTQTVPFKRGTSLRISEGRKVIADIIATEVGAVLKRPVRTSAILNFVLDKFLSPQIADMYIKEFYEKYPKLKPEKTETPFK